MRTAIYAGTFDPITFGHLDLIGRAARIFDKLIVAVAKTSRKPVVLLTADEREALVREVVTKYTNVEVDSFDGLLVDYAHAKGVRVVIRGLRAFSDFEFEFQMALTNRKLAPDIETIFLMPNEDYSYVSSSTVREVAQFGGNTSDFVPPQVEKALKAKIKKEGAR
jgi:pantetheine-phosphate adenylyltransferase